jgi:hypothetical protein
MAIVSDKARRVLEVAFANKAVRDEIVNILVNSSSIADLQIVSADLAALEADVLAISGSHIIVAQFLATTADDSTDFAAILAGDMIVHYLAADGSTEFAAVTLDETNPLGNAVIGDLYIAYRAV